MSRSARTNVNYSYKHKKIKLPPEVNRIIYVRNLPYKINIKSRFKLKRMVIWDFAFIFLIIIFRGFIMFYLIWDFSYYF